VAYSSGLAAFHALLTFLNPKKVSIGDGYHGCHGTLSLHERATGCKVLPLDCAIEELGEGDLIHLETPVNPTGRAFDIQYYADKAHARGAYLSVDSTFGPPPLQDPFLHGADVVMHSGTKYIASVGFSPLKTTSGSPNCWKIVFS
jgi:cystathionine beta-lyase/cystathionine gamma-synthase